MKHVKTATNNLIRQLEMNFFPRFGYPRIVRTDNGPQLWKVWDVYSYERGRPITSKKIAIYHPCACQPSQTSESKHKNRTTPSIKRRPEPSNAGLTAKPNIIHLAIHLAATKKPCNRALGYSPSEMVFELEIRRPKGWNDLMNDDNILLTCQRIKDAAKEGRDKYLAKIKGAAANTSFLLYRRYWWKDMHCHRK